VHVAELAGVPAAVVRRATALLAALEREGGPLGAAKLSALPLFATACAPAPGATISPGPFQTDQLTQAILALEPDRMSPREALDALYRLKELLPVPHIQRT
jgi:DNA mismatch repair protein MutS